VIAYALPAHTGVTQLLDGGVFGPFKSQLRGGLDLLRPYALDKTFDEFDFCNILCRAYRKSFNHDNITAAFRKSGLCPFDQSKLIGQSRPFSATNLNVILSTDEMFKMLERKRQTALDMSGIQPVVLKSGFLDTSMGINLTSDTAMELIKEKEDGTAKTDV